MVHRYILQRRAVVVAIRVEADISWLAEFDDLGLRLVSAEPQPD
jgi:hypothetical protein